MNLIENIREGVKSILANKLRTILTALIIAIGITSLVGILTAIDGIRSSINQSFSNLGANTFYISDKRVDRGRRFGRSEKVYPRIKYDQAKRFMKEYNGNSVATVNTTVTSAAEVKRASKVTNPNIMVKGADANYVKVEGYALEEGRNFSAFESQNGANVVLIGYEIRNALFEDDEQPLGETVSLLGSKFKVIGLLEEQGNSDGHTSADGTVIVPIETSRKISKNRALSYYIGMAINDPTQLEIAMGEATGIMRVIRKDEPGAQNSFQIKQPQSAAEKLEEITDYLRIGGFSIGFITLLGASIGLMNIMLVSVTERTKEIGVRKALGATPLRIRQQFLIEAIVITQFGGIFGILLGIGIGNIVSNFLNPGNFVIPWLWIGFGFLVGMIVGLISGYLPAYKASRLDPIESLRFE